MTEKETIQKNEEFKKDELDSSESSEAQSTTDDIDLIVRELEKKPRAEKENFIRELIRVERNHYSGPIPPPELLKGYEDVLPGSADRILAMAENQAEHRRNMEKTVVDSGVRDSRLGIICGTIVCISVIIVGLLLSLITDAAAIGAFMSITGLASLVGTFIYGTRSNSNERKQKESE